MDQSQSINNAGVLEALRDKKAKIRAAWRNHLGKAPGAGNALLRALIDPRADRGTSPELPAARLIEQVQRVDYSICDLYGEVDALKNALDEVLTTADERGAGATASLLHAHRLLDGLFGICLARTSRIHEAVLEHSARGFCEVDGEGLIVYANQAMNRLCRLADCRGRQLSDFFEFAERLRRRGAVGRARQPAELCAAC